MIYLTSKQKKEDSECLNKEGSSFPVPSLGFIPINGTSDRITYAQEAQLSQNWSLAQHPDYYVIEGKANLQKETFPELQKTTEKVYRKSGTSTRPVKVSEIHYSDLDGYGRSGTAYGIITKDMIDMSAGYREKWEKDYNPSGWYSYQFKETGLAATEADYKHSPRKVKRLPNNQMVSIALSNGKIRNGYLFDRSHLIADSIGGRPYRNNLVTGTRTQNVGNNDRKGGMQYIENKVMDHIKKNPTVHVYYKAVPVYVGTELIPRHVLVSALSSDGVIDETVRVFNTANGFNINYQAGGLLSEATLVDAAEATAPVETDNESIQDNAEELIETEDTNAADTTEEATAETASDAASQTTVYVASNGRSDVYWYKKENMPSSANLDRVMEMTEQEALNRGKKHSSSEPIN
ncbi:DNA/RNA non-specific endonuclease [Streptococcus ictaluri]|uniref:DNA/RNA non-specific endonuclease-like protein n=1 Tax=Streptococcus ictaluri 707-05 TaxID=764299 RepID=G5K1W4_9STRE|nr:DNA/RNA non-specific endonuclease-like protein [Streptococcus ictaluri 707-05]